MSHCKYDTVHFSCVFQHVCLLNVSVSPSFFLHCLHILCFFMSQGAQIGGSLDEIVGTLPVAMVRESLWVSSYDEALFPLI